MILAILQARMSSTRLPGKVLRPLAGAPLIQRQIERIRRATRIDRLVVATSLEPSDDVLAARLEQLAVPTWRGPLDDVLARYVGALHLAPEATQVVRLTADCPFTDPGLIDEVIARHLSAGADYTSNTPEHRTYPKGLDCEIMKVDALRAADRDAVDAEDREHVTRFIYRHPEQFSIASLSQDADEGEVRWTVDRPDDYVFAGLVYGGLYPARPAFTSEDLRGFIRARPDLHHLGGDRRI